MKIAIVGNAPLTLEEQNEINTYDVVSRCNNAYAWRPGDKITHLFYRPVSIKPLKSFPYYVFESNICNVFHIDKNEKSAIEPKLFGNKYISLNTREYIKYDRVVSTITNKEKIPSCGYAAYAHTKNLYPNEKIHVYGFDFRVKRNVVHNMDYEKSIIKSDKNVTFHEVVKVKMMKLHHVNEYKNSLKT